MKKYIFLVALFFFAPISAGAELYGFSNGSVFDPAVSTTEPQFICFLNGECLKKDGTATTRQALGLGPLVQPVQPVVEPKVQKPNPLPDPEPGIVFKSPSFTNSRITALASSTKPDILEFYKDVINLKIPEMSLEQCNRATKSELLLKTGSFSNGFDYEAMVICGLMRGNEHRGLGLLIVGSRSSANYSKNNPKLYPDQDFREVGARLDILLENNIKLGDTPISEITRITEEWMGGLK